MLRHPLKPPILIAALQEPARQLVPIMPDDESDHIERSPLEIIERVANRFYRRALAARALGDWGAEQARMRDAVEAAARAAPFRHARVAQAAGSAVAKLPPLREMPMAELKELYLQLTEGVDYRDVTDEEPQDGAAE